MQKYDFFLHSAYSGEVFLYFFCRTDYTDGTDKSAKRSGFLCTKGKAAEPSEARAPGGTCGVKIIMDLRMVSVFQGAYRLQYHDYLSKAHVVCFVGLLTLTL